MILCYYWLLCLLALIEVKPNSKLPLSRIMFGCMLGCKKLIPVLLPAEN
jgi:hypothetical protein